MKSFEDMQKFGKENADATMKSFGALSKSVQAIAVEMADYSNCLLYTSPSPRD